ncbi:uncharacterized protein BCR38DRAFT_494324 [Pseudomassariella vexata]|uniref:Uncharacterized protein n=1 Tax=Pseudomassariella vexata TaxID=1141098 RepID=A0A1Y2DPN7_9PEZI|nr:uncharacterized protein BCR38DRAFT_494324 [Pseudomassariella vexata]ORY61252.1 hypothetical protein BCR38DRAFT_494324 [Pseudomassariella vexata]
MDYRPIRPNRQTGTNTPAGGHDSSTLVNLQDYKRLSKSSRYEPSCGGTLKHKGDRLIHRKSQETDRVSGRELLEEAKLVVSEKEGSEYAEILVAQAKTTLKAAISKWQREYRSPISDSIAGTNYRTSYRRFFNKNEQFASSTQLTIARSDVGPAATWTASGCAVHGSGFSPAAQGVSVDQSQSIGEDPRFDSFNAVFMQQASADTQYVSQISYPDCTNDSVYRSVYSFGNLPMLDASHNLLGIAAPELPAAHMEVGGSGPNPDDNNSQNACPHISEEFQFFSPQGFGQL